MKSRNAHSNQAQPTLFVAFEIEVESAVLIRVPL